MFNRNPKIEGVSLPLNRAGIACRSGSNPVKRLRRRWQSECGSLNNTRLAATRAQVLTPPAPAAGTGAGFHSCMPFITVTAGICRPGTPKVGVYRLMKNCRKTLPCGGGRIQFITASQPLPPCFRLLIPSFPHSSAVIPHLSAVILAPLRCHSCPPAVIPAVFKRESILDYADVNPAYADWIPA